MAMVTGRTICLSRFYVTNGLGKTKGPILCGVPTVQVASLTLMHGEKYPYPKPIPYKKRRSNSFTNIFENTGSRLCDHSKIISIEGNIGVGKHAFAKRIAKEFDLLYVPGLHDDDLWVQRWNLFDVRQLNEAMTEAARCMDFKELYCTDEIDPGRAARMEFDVLEKRLLKYCQSMLHLLSTGQGFVTVRSPYSDQVFCDAMWQMGWISGAYAEYHRTTIERLYEILLPPHLVVYLDAPVPDVLNCVRRKEKEDPKFVGGKNIDENFVKAIDARYQRWLGLQPTRDGEILHIDWAEAADESEMDLILEVIAGIQLESDDSEDAKFREWLLLNMEDTCGFKRIACSNPDNIMDQVHKRWPLSAAEFALGEADLIVRNKTWHMHPMTRYRNSAMNLGWFQAMLNPTQYPKIP